MLSRPHIQKNLSGKPRSCDHLTRFIRDILVTVAEGEAEGSTDLQEVADLAKLSR